MIFTILQISFFLFLAILVFIGLGLSLKKSIAYFETHPHSSKSVVRYLIGFSFLLHFYFVFIRSSFKFIFLSLMAQVLYISLFEEYPEISGKDSRFVIGTLITIYSHFYYTSFLKKQQHNLKYLIGYLIIWIIPLIMYTLLSANNNIVSIGKIRRTPKIFSRLYDKFIFKKHKKLNCN